MTDPMKQPSGLAGQTLQLGPAGFASASGVRADTDPQPSVEAGEKVEPRPCPFCGVGPKITEYEVDDDGNTRWAVACDCANAPEDHLYAERYVSVHGTTKKEAINAWNFRAAPSEKPRPLERGELADAVTRATADLAKHPDNFSVCVRSEDLRTILAALATQERGEPVAWRYQVTLPGSRFKETVWQVNASPENAEVLREGGVTLQPLYAQSRGEAEAVEILRRLFTEKRPAYHDCIDAGEPECAWCEAENFLAALQDTPQASSEAGR